MNPTPHTVASSIHIALDTAAFGGRMPARMVFDLRGCEVVVRARLGNLSILVNAPDGFAAVESKGGTFAVADKASNYASALALSTAQDLAAALRLG
jgi:hypothetical protein